MKPTLRAMPIDFRAKILQHLSDAGGLKPYALAQRVKDHVGQNTVYDFLSGKSEINATALSYILDALEVTVNFSPFHAKQLKARWKELKKLKESKATS